MESFFSIHTHLTGAQLYVLTGVENKILETISPWCGAHLEAGPEGTPSLLPKPLLDFFFFLREKKQELVQNGKRRETTLLLPLGCSVLCFVCTHGERGKGKAKKMHWLIGYAAKASCRGKQPFPAAEGAGLSLAQEEAVCWLLPVLEEGGRELFFFSLSLSPTFPPHPHSSWLPPLPPSNLWWWRAEKQGKIDNQPHYYRHYI